MLTSVEYDIRRLIDALNNEDPADPTDELEPQEWTPEGTSLDPVARLTDSPGAMQTTIPTVDDDPNFSERTFDRMTSTRREQRIAQDMPDPSDPTSPGAFAAAQARTMPSVKGELTTEGFVKRMLAKEGMEYEWGGTTKATGFDCSGIIYRIMQKAGHTYFPRTSGEIYEHSKKISLKKAIKTRGAILYAPGHIAISLGNGKTIEAMGEDYGVVKGNAHGRFTAGGLLPELVNVPPRKRQRLLRQADRQMDKRQPRVDNDLNAVGSRNPLVTASTVFGTVLAEVAEPPQRRTENQTDNNIKTGGLKFVPKRFRSTFQEAAARYGVSARLLAAIAQHESGFDPKAVSSAGAQGVMQVMPLHGLNDPFDPKKNIFKGAEIFASYLEAAEGNVRRALAFYNAGPNADESVIQERMRLYSDPIIELWRGR
jgi:hypothetical protein